MANPLVETKLYIPARPGRVVRPRLGRQLGRAADARLTVVSAPAGFGKTTMPAATAAAWLGLADRATTDRVRTGRLC